MSPSITYLPCMHLHRHAQAPQALLLRTGNERAQQGGRVRRACTGCGVNLSLPRRGGCVAARSAFTAALRCARFARCASSAATSAWIAPRLSSCARCLFRLRRAASSAAAPFTRSCLLRCARVFFSARFFAPPPAAPASPSSSASSSSSSSSQAASSCAPAAAHPCAQPRCAVPLHVEACLPSAWCRLPDVLSSMHADTSGHVARSSHISGAR